jgi:hypothetical protein
VVKVVVLDSTPLGLLAAPPHIPAAAACTSWANALVVAGHRLIIPEITDYEVRRELLRLRAVSRVRQLDSLRGWMEYLALDTPMMRRAADLWAFARQTGQPTAGDNTIDIDMILIAQAESLADPNTVIATGNVGHLARFFPAELWSNVTP